MNNSEQAIGCSAQPVFVISNGWALEPVPDIAHTPTALAGISSGATVAATTPGVFSYIAPSTNGSAADVGLAADAASSVAAPAADAAPAHNNPAVAATAFAAADAPATTARTVGELLEGLGVRRPLVVASRRFADNPLCHELRRAGIPFAQFSGFSPNPTITEVAAGISALDAHHCDGLLSVGGGSAMDIAKSIKYLADIPAGERAATWRPKAPSDIAHIAVATTAGTGSESTHFAVCYVDGVKTSFAHRDLLPDAAVLDVSSLATLPDVQRKATLLDALCQAIESHWSRGSNEESRVYSAAAMRTIAQLGLAYAVGGEAPVADDIPRRIMVAANQAGKAINITKTTAAHAMSYKLTSLYGLPHGHAVALVLPATWNFLMTRGSDVDHERLTEIACLLTAEPSAKPDAGLAWFCEFFAALDLATHVDAEPDDMESLVASVNVERLSNFPIPLTPADLEVAYATVLS